MALLAGFVPLLEHSVLCDIVMQRNQPNLQPTLTYLMSSACFIGRAFNRFPLIPISSARRTGCITCNVQTDLHIHPRVYFIAPDKLWTKMCATFGNKEQFDDADWTPPRRGWYSKRTNSHRLIPKQPTQ